MSKKTIRYKSGEDKVRKANGTWYRGKDCNFIPSRKNLSEKDAIDKYILKGWCPKEKIISKNDMVTSFGSCFARHINKFISSKGYKVGQVGKDIKVTSDTHVIRFGAGIVNTFALLQQFEWAYENKNFNEALWYGSNGELAKQSEQIRQSTKAIFDQTSVFILTLGLSEVWYNKKTEEVFWRAIPMDKFDESVHGFRLSTVQENCNNLYKIIDIIKKHRPNAKIIFSLSPVPLIATFRPVSCITADSVSKSILRVALDAVITEYQSKYSDIYYWPSYEIIKYFITNPYEEDNRHINNLSIRLIMEAFERHYLKQ